MPCRATQDGRVTVERSDKTCPLEERMASHSGILGARTPWAVRKGKKIWLYTWVSPDGRSWNQIDYILCSWRWRNSIQPAKTRPDRGSDHELLIAKFRLKWKKVGKNTIPFRYHLNQIPKVKVANRFKSIDLAEGIKSCRWRFITLYKRWGAKPSQRKRNARRQNGCLRRPYRLLRKQKWKAKEKGKCKVQKNSKERKESFLKWTGHRNRGKQ